MNSTSATILFYAAIGLVVPALVFSYLRGASPTFNRAAAEDWVRAMDVTVDGQRFHGHRVTMLADVTSGRRGAMGYELSVACRTKSRRAFHLSVTTSFGVVTGWELTPMDFDEMVAALAEDGRDVSAYADISNRPSVTSASGAAPRASNTETSS